MNRPAVFRFDRRRFRWKGIPPKPYKAVDHGPLAWEGVERFVLVGTAGEPTAFQLRYFEIAPGGWRANPSESPAGAMTGLGIHHVDTFQYLLGPIARVMAFSRRQVLKGIELDDTTAILFEFASGILGYLGTAWAVANRTNYLALHGTEAQAFSEVEGSRLFLWKKGDPDRVAVPLAPVDVVVEELSEFARCIRNGGQPEVGGEDATANAAVLEAIVESAETGRPVTVSDRVRG